MGAVALQRLGDALAPLRAWLVSGCFIAPSGDDVGSTRCSMHPLSAQLAVVHHELDLHVDLFRQRWYCSQWPCPYGSHAAPRSAHRDAAHAWRRLASLSDFMPSLSVSCADAAPWSHGRDVLLCSASCAFMQTARGPRIG